MLVDQRAVLAGPEGVDPERVDPEVLAHRNASAAPLDVVEARDLHFGLSFIRSPPIAWAVANGPIVPAVKLADADRQIVSGLRQTASSLMP